MATSESDIQKMFGRMDGQKPDRLRQMFDEMDKQPSTEFHSMFNQMDAKHPDAISSMFEKMDTAKPAVVFNEDADFSTEPSAVENFKPVEFKPFDNSDLDFSARLAGAATVIGGADNRADRMPDTHPTLNTNLVNLKFKSRAPTPTWDEYADAFFSTLGADALKVNQRYRAETGRNLAMPDVPLDELEQYRDEDGGFSIPVAPTVQLYRAINAYGHGGMSGLQAEIARMQEEKRHFNETDKPSDGDVSAIRKGLADVMMTEARLVNNVKGLAGGNAAQSARNAQFIEDSAQSIPAPKTAAGRFLRGVTGIVASAPLYMNPAAPLVAYTENLHRGPEAAIKEGLKVSAATGAGRGVGQYAEGLTPFERQIISRHAAGSTNVALGRLSGEDKSLLDSFLSYAQGAAYPVGKKGKGEREGPTHDYVHETLGELKRVPDQSGVGNGWVRVVTNDGEVGVVRSPNPEGQGGVRRRDSSLPPATRRTGERILDAVNIPRAVETSYDVSAIGRPGLILSVLHPVKAAKNFARSIPTLFSEGKADKILNEIHSSPLAPVRRAAGLYLADYHKSGLSITAGEEGFQSSTAQSIPGVRASERAYVTFLDKMRADAFDGYVKSHPSATPENLKSVADFINKATGRGNLGRWGEKHATALSQMFYSPRYTLSRVQLLTTPFKGEAKAFAARNLVQFVGSGIAMMGLARAAGLEVGVNPLSSDFGKIKIGNTHVDIWGGSAQIARYTAQLMTGKATELESGRTVPRSRLRTAINFLRTRAAPQVSVPLDTALGSDAIGNLATLSNLPKRALMPLAWRDIEAAIEDDLQSGGSGRTGAAKGSLGLLGVGANTITPKTPEEKISREVERIRELPENKGLKDDALRHNATVKLEAYRLMSQIDDSDLNERQKEVARRGINTMFYYSSVRPGETRALSSIRRVFNERRAKADELVRRKIAELKKVPPRGRYALPSKDSER